MSRCDEARDWDGDRIPPGLYQRWRKLALTGKPGQAILRELREALLAMPDKRLISDRIIQLNFGEDGDEQSAGCEVCAIGALMVHRMQQGRLVSRGSKIETLEHLYSWYGRSEGIYDTIDAAEGIGVTQTLAWLIAEQNDEGVSENAPDEARWRAMLDWIERRIREVPDVPAG